MLRGKAYAEEFFDKQIDFTDTTEMVMNNEIYFALDQLGYRGGMLDGRPWVLEWREPTHLYSHAGHDLALFCRHHELSDDVGYRFSDRKWAGFPLHAETYAKNLRAAWGDFVFIGWDFETFGEHHSIDTGIFSFMKQLPRGAQEARRPLDAAERGRRPISDASFPICRCPSSAPPGRAREAWSSSWETPRSRRSSGSCTRSFTRPA